MKDLRLLPLLTLLVALSACAAPGPKEVRPQTKSYSSAETEGIEVVTREAVYLYNETKALSRQVTIKIGGEPFLLPSGYARLAGVVSGGRPVAWLEIGGRGLAVSLGETVDGYRITRIDEGLIVLRKEN
jgi:hypothetical protein